MSKWGPYVRRRRRENGTWRYYQTFDPRWRPKSFPKTVELYVQTHSGEPGPDERDEIMRRALEVHDALIVARTTSGAPAAPRGPMPVNDWTLLADQLTKTSLWWDDLSEASRKDMRSWFSVIGRGLDQKPELSPGVISKVDIEVFVRQRRLTASSQLKYQGAFNRLLEQAVAQGMRVRHEPISFRIKRKARKRARLWEASDVQALSDFAEAQGEIGMADLIRAGYETGVRLGDLRQLRYGFDYVGGELYFLTNKTDAPILLPLCADTRARLDRRFRQGDLLFPTQTGRVFNSSSLGRQFRLLADLMPQYRSTGLGRGDPDLISLRHLRHSAIVAFAAKNVPVPLIASVTGHALETVYQILQLYCPRHPFLARRAMEMRFGDLIAPNPRPVIGWDQRTNVAALPRPEKPMAA